MTVCADYRKIIHPGLRFSTNHAEWTNVVYFNEAASSFSIHCFEIKIACFAPKMTRRIFGLQFLSFDNASIPLALAM